MLHLHTALSDSKEPRSWICFKLERIRYKQEDHENIPMLNLYHSKGLWDPRRAILDSLIFNPVQRELASSISPIRLGSETIPSSTADAKNMWRHWFRTCSESHSNCINVEKKLQPLLPDRLIEIVDDGDDRLSWRMVHSSKITLTSNPRYTTLSHCWGKSQHLRLQTQNYSTIQEGQSDSDLPKTYRDALRVSLSLGIQFIWIDSLCIIQDDEADWKSQSPLMGSIYYNASCNIAATWGADGDDGCFRTGTPNADRQARITLYEQTGQLMEYDVVDTSTYSKDITHGNLNTRGWVVQERYLARRQLSFAQDQVYWECPSLSASEEFPFGLPEFVWKQDWKQDFRPNYVQRRAKPELDFSSELHFRETWSVLVELYSRCSFTKPSDRVIALARLVSRTQEATKDAYIAGFWRKDLYKQLCWYCDDGERRQDTGGLVPTWSWLKMKGNVNTDRKYCFLSTVTSYVRVIDDPGQATNSSRVFSFATATLKLKRIGLRVDIHLEYCDVYSAKCLDTKLEDLCEGCLAVEIDWGLDRWLTDQEIRYCRLGIFTLFGFDGIVARKLGQHSGSYIEKEIDVDDERLGDLVHIVIIV
ncbi:HET-domain-containing protein [Hypoxylon sp. FL1857]|nr:HET-domain-containing protein [Hypoxylon sp. FL1857]